MGRFWGVAVTLVTFFVFAISASAATLTITKTSPSYRQDIRYLNNVPSAGTATFKVQWSVPRAEVGVGVLCFAVGSDTGTPRILNSRAEQGTPNGADPELKWSMRCSNDFENPGSLYDVSVETTTPGPMEIEAYLLRADKLTSGTDAATFDSAIIKSTTAFASFRPVCSLSSYNNPPACNRREVIGRFELNVDASPLIGVFNDPTYVSTRAAGLGIFKVSSSNVTSGEVKKASGFVRLTHLFFPIDNQELLLSVSGGSDTGYDRGKSGQALELGLKVMETNIAGCQVGTTGSLALFDGRKGGDEVGVDICGTKRLYKGDGKENNVSVTIGKPKKK